MLGGHTIKEDLLIFGYSITGIINIKDIILNSNAKVGDDLILTKPLGLGVVNTAVKKKLKLDNKVIEKSIEIMKQLNRLPKELFNKSLVNSCTDITGFGFIGHCIEMASSSKISFKINCDCVPFIDGINSETIEDTNCGGTLRNQIFFDPKVFWRNDSFKNKSLFYDPQTSGGLLISLPKAHSSYFVSELHKLGFGYSRVIGSVIKQVNKNIIIC